MVVHWLLLELGEPVELIQVDLSKPRPPGLLDANPGGRVPALKIDGRWHSECAALLIILAERDRAKRFAPTDDGPERHEYLQWMFYLSNTLQTAYRRLFYNHEPAGRENCDAVARLARSEVERCFDRINDHLERRGPYLAGSKMTVGDFFLTMLARWSRNQPRPATEWPAVKRLVDEMRQREALRQVHAIEGLTEWIDD